MIATLIASLGVPLLSRILRGALSKIHHPIAQQAAKALTDLDVDLPADYVQEANQQAQIIATTEINARADVAKAVNKSLQKEIMSGDFYVRRMRPTFGYLMALTWAAQMFGLAYVMIFDSEHAPAIVSAMAEMTGIWGIGLSVLGIYVYKRSEEKKTLF